MTGKHQLKDVGQRFIPTGSFPQPVVVDARYPCSGTIVRAKAPLRVSFVGGGTDLPQYYEKHGGAVLSSTINRFACVTLYPREDREVRIRSLDCGYHIKYNLAQCPAYNGVLDLVKASIVRMGMERGIDMSIRSDAPAGSGLGGSSALTAAVIGVLSTAIGRALTRYQAAELNYTIERIDLKIAGGKQDQYATTFGGFNLIEFRQNQILVNPLRIDSDVLNDLEAHLLLCYTGSVRADLGLIEKQMQLYHEKRTKTLKAMARLHEMAYEMKEALLFGRLDQFGEMLHEAYANKKRMNPHIVEGTSADVLYEKAQEHGAIGGKLCGAGGGGYLLLYCETDRQPEVRYELEKLGGRFTDFAFDSGGMQVWRSTAR